MESSAAVQVAPLFVTCPECSNHPKRVVSCAYCNRKGKVAQCAKCEGAGLVVDEKDIYGRGRCLSCNGAGTFRRSA